MARFKDVLPSQQGWIHDLAKAEIHPEAERLLQLGGAADPQQAVEESTVDFLTELRDLLQDHARAFNAFSEAGQKYQEIKIYNTTQSAADFMLFRNQIKLMFTNPTHGVIQVSFAQHNRSVLAPGASVVDGQHSHVQMSGPNAAQSQDLLAQIGPFREVFWTFQGEKVTPDQVAKFYFAEFTRATRDSKKTRAGNHLLLEQIKALLQEKGIDL
jgi:hypothetical protein